jgi:hypothetical protein
MNDLALLALKLSTFTIPLLDQRFCSSTVDILVSFRLSFGCRALYFHCGRYLSKDFAMFHYSSSAHLFGVFAFKAIEETYVWFWGEVSESELSS